MNKGRFLVMNVNQTPHLNHPNDIKLKTSGGLKDGWSHILPKDKYLLHEEVTKLFFNELRGHLKEQTDALKNLYLPRGKFFTRKPNCTSHFIVKDADAQHDSDKCEMTFLVKRGLQVIACITYNDETGVLSDMVVRPSVKDGNYGKALVNAALTHAKLSGKEKIFVNVDTDASRSSFKQLGFHPLGVSEDQRGTRDQTMYKSRL